MIVIVSQHGPFGSLRCFFASLSTLVKHFELPQKGNNRASSIDQLLVGQFKRLAGSFLTSSSLWNVESCFRFTLLISGLSDHLIGIICLSVLGLGEEQTSALFQR